jgi:SAM-dependent methyltransferase
MNNKLSVPDELNRNAPAVTAQGVENTGFIIMAHVAERLGLKDLDGRDILDVGCGVRFTQAILNLDIPIGSYTGVDVYKPLIDFLQSEVHDPRFKFAWWDAHNGQYHPSGRPMALYDALPIDGLFDIIWLFSVFTHLVPDDSVALLKLLRKYVREDGALVFTAFINEDVVTYENRGPPGAIHAFYGEDYFRSFIETAGWRVQSLDPPSDEHHVRNLFICRPN